MAHLVPSRAPQRNIFSRVSSVTYRGMARNGAEFQLWRSKRALRPGQVACLDDRVGQFANTGDLHPDDVPGAQELLWVEADADAGRGSGSDQIARI